LADPAWGMNDLEWDTADPAWGMTDLEWDTADPALDTADPESDTHTVLQFNRDQPFAFTMNASYQVGPSAVCWRT